MSPTPPLLPSTQNNTPNEADDATSPSEDLVVVARVSDTKGGFGYYPDAGNGWDFDSLAR